MVLWSIERDRTSAERRPRVLEENEGYHGIERVRTSCYYWRRDHSEKWERWKDGTEKSLESHHNSLKVSLSERPSLTLSLPWREFLEREALDCRLNLPSSKDAVDAD